MSFLLLGAESPEEFLEVGMPVDELTRCFRDEASSATLRNCASVATPARIELSNEVTSLWSQGQSCPKQELRARFSTAGVRPGPGLRVLTR